MLDQCSNLTKSMSARDYLNLHCGHIISSGNRLSRNSTHQHWRVGTGFSSFHCDTKPIPTPGKIRI